MQRKKISWYLFSEFEEIGMKGFGPSDKSMIFIIPTLISTVVGIIFGMKKRIENAVMTTESSNFFDNNTIADENFQENVIEENDDDLYDNRQNVDETIQNIPQIFSVVDPQRPLIDI